MLNIPEEGRAAEAATFGANLAGHPAPKAHLRLVDGANNDEPVVVTQSSPDVVVPFPSRSKDKRASKTASRKAKRAIDVAVAAGGLLTLWPLMLVIAGAVKVTSRGGAIFAHERVGRDGKNFKLYKFRSMREGTVDRLKDDPELRARYVAQGFKLTAADVPVTKVGRFLRKSSLDELPQLWNVLVGDMSLVGVRPLVPTELALRDSHDQDLYATMAPGLTGLWQVVGRSTIGGAERSELDRRYIEEWSFWGDVNILLRTPRAVLRPNNTH